MPEIMTEVLKDSAGTYFITEEHTIADIARWIIVNDWDEEIIYLITKGVKEHGS